MVRAKKGIMFWIIILITQNLQKKTRFSKMSKITHVLHLFGDLSACTYPLRTNSQELRLSEYLRMVDKTNGKIRRIDLNGHVKSFIERPRENA